MIIRVPENYDSKFRFILVAAERAKQLQSGAPPKIESKYRKSAFVAIRETEEGLVPFEILEEEESTEE